MARIGFFAKMYVAGVLCDLIQDFTTEDSFNEVESRNRGSRFVKTLKGMRTKVIDFDMSTVESNPGWQALKAAYNSSAEDSYIEIEFTNRVKTSTQWQGFKANWEVTKFTQSEPMDDEAITSVSIRISANSPTEPLETHSP